MGKKQDPKRVKMVAIATAVINTISPKVNADGTENKNGNRIILAAEYGNKYAVEDGKLVVIDNPAKSLPNKVVLPDGKAIALNLTQYREAKAHVLEHCNVCAKLVATYNHIMGIVNARKDEGAIPKKFTLALTYLPLVFIARNAHKAETLEKGFDKFDFYGGLQTTLMAIEYSVRMSFKSVDMLLIQGIQNFHKATGMDAAEFAKEVLPLVKMNSSQGVDTTCAFCMEAYTKWVTESAETESVEVTEVKA